VGEAPNGEKALDLIARHQPDIAFLDIRMPGLSGIQVARRMPESCRVVFITAYDQYAVEAFENEAIDYVLKPVTHERLAKTVNRLKRTLSDPSSFPIDTLKGVERVLSGLVQTEGGRPLRWVRVHQRDTVRLVPVDEICYFKASDKYTVVRTETDEYLIRKPIRELTQELDPHVFWQIHRGTVVNVTCIAHVSRSLTGRGVVRLKNLPDSLAVSQPYMHLFKQM
jgi:DNA-binding LytR/AlgR family response regulator